MSDPLAPRCNTWPVNLESSTAAHFMGGIQIGTRDISTDTYLINPGIGKH